MGAGTCRISIKLANLPVNTYEQSNQFENGNAQLESTHTQMNLIEHFSAQNFSKSIANAAIIFELKIV